MNTPRYEELLKELEQYPNLKRYVEHFHDTDGKPEDKECLPYLIIWVRRVLGETDAAEVFEMSEEQAEDFYSWGHNSRWANTFFRYLEENFDFCVSKCIELAKTHTDVNVEDYIKSIHS